MSEIRSELVIQFHNWILAQKRPEYEIREAGKESVEFHTDHAVACVNFYEMNVIELTIQDKKTEETFFYLHFQMNDMEHACDLFHQMIDALLKRSMEKQVRVLLCCSSGMTTGFFAEQLRQAASLLALDYTFNAVSYDRVFREALNYDIVLLAPQIGFQLKKIQNVLQDIPVLVIPAQIFARYDSGELLKLIQKTLEERKPVSTKAEQTAAAFKNSRKILAICVFNSARYIQTCYRYYKNGNIETEGRVLKEKISVRDVQDIIESMLALYPEIEAVGLSMPGTALKGRLWLPDSDIRHENIAQEIHSAYGIRCILSNDCNAIAAGIYALEDRYQDLIFHFQPYGYRLGGEGIIANGKLIKGRGNAAGEISNLQKLLRYDASADRLASTPEGVTELLAKTLCGAIAVTAPEAVFIHAALLPDLDTLRKAMEKLMPAEEIPDLYYVDDMREYMMVGTLLKTLEWLKIFAEGQPC